MRKAILKGESRRIMTGGGTKHSWGNGAGGATWTVDGVEHVMLQKHAPPTTSFVCIVSFYLRFSFGGKLDLWLCSFFLIIPKYCLCSQEKKDHCLCFKKKKSNGIS